MQPNQELMLVGFRSEGSLSIPSVTALRQRVFVQDGQLNMILGQVDQFHAEFRDHDKGLPPIGSRNSEIALAGSIPPTTGVEQFNDRQDWLVLDLGLAVPPKQDRRIGYDRVGATQTASVSATAPAAAPKPAPAQEKTAYQQDKAAPASIPTANMDPELQRIEQEFELLQRLRTKGLITDQDYEQKKKQLLEQF
ncbi:MAG: SHOCT domain-containing protein [Candidatus Competibacteraceae bacterium]